jgi:heterotetrameric sarcosine oxidase gamma subunit
MSVIAQLNLRADGQVLDNALSEALRARIDMRVVAVRRVLIISFAARQPTPGFAEKSGATILVWLNPSQCLAMSFDGEIDQTSFGPEAKIDDVTDGAAFFRVSGRDWPQIFARLCALDPHAPALGPGRVAFSPFAGIPAMIYRADQDHIFIKVDRDLADYVQQSLAHAASALAFTGDR